MAHFQTAQLTTRSLNATPFRKIFAGLAGIFALAAPARAVVVINIQQVGSDVVATSSGSLDLSGLGLVTANGSTSFDYMSPSSGILFVGTPGSSSVYTGFTTSGNLGSGSFTSANSNSGDLMGADMADSYLFLPHNYASGSNIAGSATWSVATFGTLGLTAGSSLTYSWSGDSITVNVLSPVPEPATAALLSGCGAAFLVGIYRRRKNPRIRSTRL